MQDLIVAFQSGNKRGRFVVTRRFEECQNLSNCYDVVCAECGHSFTPISVSWKDLALGPEGEMLRQAVQPLAEEHLLRCEPVPAIVGRPPALARAQLLGEEPPLCELCVAGADHEHPAAPGALTDPAAIG